MKSEATCPRCGAAMNHQADKLRDPATREEADSGHATGGTVLAIFACPNCGWIDSRLVASEER